MFGAIRLAYLVVSVSNVPEWKRFCSQMLGLPEPATLDDGALAYRLDEAAHRLILREGGADDIEALGWEVDGDENFAVVLVRAEKGGAQPAMMDEAAARLRNVHKLAAFTGPDGVRNELAMALARAASPFRSELVPGGFRTDAMGLGHAVLIASNPEAAGAFYREVLGMRLSQTLRVRIGPVTIEGVFLHCNPRHHSLALFKMPSKRRLQHVMIEARELRDIGLAWERAQKLDVPITLTLGQHPEPDGMVSFYGLTPSGFEFEMGANGRLIDPAKFEPIALSLTSDWGHHPTARAKWNLLSAAIGAKFGRRIRA
ncbi:MAG: VOC family protein [Betaproteobacteria bacterium]|nr:VOC family protein [Betaproteobacteria bacterium]